MVSFRELREADPDVFDDMAAEWARLAGQLTATAGDLKTAAGGLDGWQGEAADAARAHIDDVRSGYDTAAEYLEKVPPALRDLSDAIIEAQQTVDGVVESVSYPLSLNAETGEVRASNGAPGICAPTRRRNATAKEPRNSPTRCRPRWKPSTRPTRWPPKL